MTSTQDIQDTLNDDGTVSRIVTTTIIYTAKEYQNLQDSIQRKIDELQATLEPLQATVALSLKRNKIV